MATRRSTSTIPPERTAERLRRARLGRRVVIGLLLAAVLAAAAGLAGVRTTEARSMGGGYELRVRYASVSRPGLATPFDIEVTRRGGVTEQVTLAVSSDYLAAFDENGLDPEPVISRSDGSFTYWTFDPPPGGPLVVSFDARLEPAVQWKREGNVRLIREGADLAETAFTTWVLP